MNAIEITQKNIDTWNRRDIKAVVAAYDEGVTSISQ